MKRNKLKKVFSGIMTAALALTLCMGTAVPVSAGSGTEDSPAKATITKKFQYARGISTPAATFTFAFTKVSEDGAAPSTDMPVITNKTVSYTAGEAGTTVANLTTVTKETTDILDGLTWPHAGEYVYSIVENESGYTIGTGETLTYSQATYKLYVRVANGTSGLYVANVMAERVVDDNGDTVSPGEKVDPEPGGGAGNGLAFTNVFTKRGGGTDTDVDSLVISNAVDGTYGDRTKQFNFSLTVTNSPTSSATSYSGTITRADASTSTVTVTPDAAQTFTLAHGEKLTFSDLPAGTTYNLSQTGATGYKPSYKVIENGGTEIAASAANFGDGLSTGSRLVGENVNSADFTNTYNTITDTGILVNNLPFIVLIGVSLMALGAVVVSRKRKMGR